jgi:choline dehydrogenase-like flavoprotein
MDAMEAFDRVASFMVIIRDDSRGRIRLRKNGGALITYWMQRSDVERLHQGLLHVAEIFRAAGASRLFPLVPRMPILEDAADLAEFRGLRLKARDAFLTSFHPMGTCRMGTDPAKSVVDLDHETHDVPGLYVVDGSILPGPASVNPQLTIMALASRAADRIAARLD